MRIRKISSDKIVVQLTDSDLEYFDLNIYESRPQAEDLHKLLFEVMELVKTETGFDPYNGGQVVVEASMSQSGMSLIISKVCSGKKRMTRDEFSKVKNITVKSDVSADDIANIAKCVGLKTKRLKHHTSKITTFIFNDFQDFENAVCALGETNFSNTSLYRTGKRYALIFKDTLKDEEHNVLSEYSVHIKYGDVAAFSIRESWCLTAENDELSIMAYNIRKMNYL